MTADTGPSVVAVYLGLGHTPGPAPGEGAYADMTEPLFLEHPP